MKDFKNIFPEAMENDPDFLEKLKKAIQEADTKPVETYEKTIHKILARPEGYWNNTGVFKPKGLILVVGYVKGTWKSNPHWGPTTGNGDGRYIARSTYLRPGAPERCLIGKIGGNSQGGGSETFPLGDHGYVPAEYEGLLWLTVNDEKVGFGDNSGHIFVSISNI